MELYGNCILKTQILPAFIRYAVKNKNENNITKAINILSSLYNLYKSLENHNHSFISPRTDEYKKSFEIMFSKLKNAGTDFSKDQELKNLKFTIDDQIQDFIIEPMKEKFLIRKSNFENDSGIENSSSNNNLSNSKTQIIFKKPGIKTVEESEIMNLVYEQLQKKTLTTNENEEKKEKINEEKRIRKSTQIQNNPPEFVKPQKVYSIEEENLPENQPSPFENLNKKIRPKLGLVKKETSSTINIIKITGKDFEGQNFDVEKEINRVIGKMKNINKKKLKFEEVTEREGKLDKLYNSDKLKELLTKSIQIPEESPINKLMESSEYLSNQLFTFISKQNKDSQDEIPFKKLEVNILLDCARTIGDTEKFFVMLQVCALTTAFHSLEIPYLIAVVGDSGFKVVIKELDEKHSIENLQKALDCIFIKRCNTNIASCIKTATDKFKSLGKEDAHRVFYMFTNGLDEEFALFDQWKNKIFVHDNHSFAFIFSKPKTIKKEQSEFLTDFWGKFKQYCKENNLLVELTEMYMEKLYNKNYSEINEENVKEYIISMVSVLRRLKESDHNEKTEKAVFEIDELNNIPLNENLENLGKMILDNSLRQLKEDPYLKKIKLNQFKEPIQKLNQKESKEISKNIGSIMKIKNPIKEEENLQIRQFMRIFKTKKEKINLSLLEMIFKPNLATQTILTDVGTHIDVNELIKYFLNPTPNPRIYREIGDGFIKNYGVTVIIDSSISCFHYLSSQHTWSTIQILLSAFGSIDLPCFDLIISGNPNPYVVCSEKNTLDILSEKSYIWPILFDLLNKNIKHTDLASAIRAAYNLHNFRKLEHPDFLFIITDGLFSSSEIKRIVKNVNYCVNKGINVFGIGVGVSPFGIEKLFPNIIYSHNPDKLIQGIATCFSGISNNNLNMKTIKSEFKINFDNNNITDSQQNPLYKELKNELMNIPVELSGFDYYQTEIPQNAKEEEDNGQYSIQNYGMYEKNFFKDQKLLIVMPYSCEMNENEDKRLSYQYIQKKSSEDTECIQSSIDYTGIKTVVVTNYRDAIRELIKPGTYKSDYCDYYACIIMSGEPYPELPDSKKDPNGPYLLGQFINVIKKFWENGGALGLFADNAPYNYQVNVIIEKLFPNVNFRVAGNHPGTQIISGDDSGQLIGNGKFNRKIQLIDNYQRNSISHSLYTIYEGKTISYFVEKPNDENLLYFGENNELKMITDPKKLDPFIPFSKDSDGGFNSVFYSSNDNKGDIVVDCSYTKFFLEMGTEGTPRYIQNIVSWLGAPEKHQQRDNCKDGTDYRPNAIGLQINWDDRWTGFKERTKPIEKMKTLFAVDCSGSIDNISQLYFKKLIELKNKYYNMSRGDKFYIWDDRYQYLSHSEMNQFISNKNGRGETSSSLIAEIGRREKNGNFEHLIIVTDGQVSTNDIDTSDNKVKNYGLQYKYVSTYIIGKGGNESVGCPYSRGCPGVTYIIDNYGNEKQQASLTKEDQNALNGINNIRNWSNFKKIYYNLFNAIRAKCLGREADSDLKNKLNNLKNRIKDYGSEISDFEKKFNELYNMADGKIRDVNKASAAA